MKTRVLHASLSISGGIFLVVLLVHILVGQAQGSIAGPPGPWTKYEGNPVVVTGAVGSWEANSVGDPVVIFDDPIYKMWYVGGGAGNIYSTGYATSTNGITWIKYPGNPVLTGTAGSWDANIVASSDVMFDGAMYYMWYWGADEVGGIYAIGYATSTNGIMWTKYDQNPIITTGTTSSWDARFILCPTVISDTGVYKMWYTGVDNSGLWSLGYAVSINGISWTKYPGNPVLQTGLTGSWDESRILCPEVILDGTTYRMWYTGQDSNKSRRVGYAISPDGISWAKSASNPVLSEGIPDSWEARQTMHASVLLEGNTYKMWYTGDRYTQTISRQIGYAAADAISPITTVVSTTQGGVITDTSDLTTSIEIPAEAVTDTTTIVYTLLPSITNVPSPTFAFAGHAFSLNAYRNDVLILGFAFNEPITITIEYSNEDMEGLVEKELLLYYWDGNTWADAVCVDYDRNPGANIIKVPVCHLSDFILFSKKENYIYVPIILKSSMVGKGR